ncbi:MAG: nucleoside-diphosphate kinase [Metamycoplasmataceae bacterium]
MEKTFLMIKPNAVKRHLIGKVITKIEEKGLNIVSIKYLSINNEQAKAHYDVHEGKPFYDSLIKNIQSGPVVAIALKGKDAVAITRALAGATDPIKANPGTIRGDYSNDMLNNIVHTSDSIERALYELSIYFTNEELN